MPSNQVAELLLPELDILGGVCLEVLLKLG